MITLEKKIILRRKDEQTTLNFSRELKVKLLWKSKTDLDLCLFFVKRNGEVGGVFPDEYIVEKRNLKSFEKLPFMLHCNGYVNQSQVDGENIDQIRIFNFDEIDEAYICVINYDAVMSNVDKTFMNDTHVIMDSDSNDFVDILVDSAEKGSICYVCSIKNENSKYVLKNVSRLVNVEEAYNDIPGFSLICND